MSTGSPQLRAPAEDDPHTIATWGFNFCHRGEDADLAAARLCFERAAKLGHPGAMAMLGFMLAGGKGGPRDQAAARVWFQYAADLGEPGAHFGLAVDLMERKLGQGSMAPIHARAHLLVAREGGFATRLAKTTTLKR